MPRAVGPLAGLLDRSDLQPREATATVDHHCLVRPGNTGSPGLGRKGIAMMMNINYRLVFSPHQHIDLTILRPSGGRKQNSTEI
ncbi:hypothetical protein PoB_007455100 [Plakobranchus ocellatus]|uniref:Uncharacterized protein n=1 Tax=Plakobranchus ocellatus TaxID=259542 RepID=A0AAV4DW14_9GAST|nr:hypothetical protein PoB_007455100 [Plakobranchus ocellatus]